MSVKHVLPTSRAELDEVNSENSALKDRLAVLHQDVMRLEEEVSKKKYDLTFYIYYMTVYLKVKPLGNITTLT